MPANLRKRATSSTTTSTTTSELTSQPSPPSKSSSPTSRDKIDKSGLYDLAQIKRLLDDEVIAFMEDRGYEEAVLVSNVKIVAGTGATIAAVYSHFNPYEYPANRNLILFCVIFYAVCVAAINIASYLWENSATFVGKLGAKPRRISKGALTRKVWVFSKVGEKGSSDYKIDLKVAPRGKRGSISVSHPYELYFTEEGKFLKDVFRQHMTEALNQLDAANAKKAS